ncbi:MAG: sulfite exporter TauE/SafE family protein [Gammaproteobacteria bacterium]|nr:sulfite exporter TauE/SafE family protein [Gammaproteobacteria bacterium]MBU1645461.1 sulfite exporter TauE/SafE family protein [Gammaproteobacteria bacterium]MBU1971084.1 sulfite exporter TauE/SafE family protein [Gammaproteobacteria bacterium]
MLLLVIIAGAATGIVLGLFGSGGSIIAMPALMVLLDVEAKSAIAMSLGIVAVTATITAWDHWRHGNVDTRVALVFGIFGIVGTFAGAKVGVITPVAVQLALFALVMYAAAWKMLKPALVPQLSAAGGLPPPERAVEVRMGHIAAHGIGVGVLTGVVGVGGGFLIVPALALLSGLRMKLAIGTSLAIVAAKSYAGFLGYLGAVPIDWNIMGAFTAVTVAGSFAGTRLAHRFSQETLKRGFGGFLVIVASYILLKSTT